MEEGKAACLFFFRQGYLLGSKVSHEFLNRLHCHPFDRLGSKPARPLIANTQTAAYTGATTTSGPSGNLYSERPEGGWGLKDESQKGVGSGSVPI
ncbi:MAG TPA: hypothetical protein VMU04_01850 [Candidatus Acidoferrum sp.]|nr:hypothetical protein [Candidatus Acidoferrum sp.]